MHTVKRLLHDPDYEATMAAKRQAVELTPSQECQKQTLTIHGIKIVVATTKPVKYDEPYINNTIEQIISNYSLQETTLANFIKQSNSHEDSQNPAFNRAFVEFVDISSIVLNGYCKTQEHCLTSADRFADLSSLGLAN